MKRTCGQAGVDGVGTLARAGRPARAPAATSPGATALAAAAIVGWLVLAAAAQPLAITFRNSANLGASTIDQNNSPFTVTGMSGLTWLGGTQYVAVMDNSNKLVFLNASVAADGSIASATISGGRSLAETHDFEGIAWLGNNAVLVSEEDTPAVRSYFLTNGGAQPAYPTQAVFANRRSNFGFESLARRPDGRVVWTANEEALTVDGPISTPTAGTVVRLQRYDVTIFGVVTAGPQYAYVTEPMHGSVTSGSRSGLSDLLALPDGRLIALERSLAFSLEGLFKTRIFEIDRIGATDISGIPGLIGQSYVPVGKRLLYSGSLTNLEGLTLGPRLSSGGCVLLGIVDDGDPVSVNQVVSFVLTGRIAIPGDTDGDCDVDQDDLDQVLFGYGGPVEPWTAGDVDGDGDVDQDDLDEVLFGFGTTCP